MSKKLFIVVAVVFCRASFTSAGAIPRRARGNGHPYGALLLVPGIGFCSGTLIAPTVVLTAGHCTSFFELAAQYGYEIWVTFDAEAAVDLSTWEPTGGQGTWYISDTSVTHPDYVDAAWPFTADYGVVLLDDPVIGVTPATLPDSGAVDTAIGTTGQTSQRFNDVGLGRTGSTFGANRTIRTSTVRKVLAALQPKQRLGRHLTRCADAAERRQTQSSLRRRLRFRHLPG
jgi:hypothetical protein